MAERIGWGPIVNHAGGTYGFISFFYVDRKNKSALIVWGNCANMMILKSSIEMVKILKGFPAQPVEIPQLVSRSEGELKPYIGKYQVKKITPGWTMKTGSIL